MRVIRAKLHGVRVTGADLHYHGSITLDPEYCTAAGLYPLEFVEIWNKNSGARITTYVIFGEAGSRCCILYGLKPTIVTFTPNNEIDQILHYEVYKSAARDFDFRIVDATATKAASVHNYANVNVRAICADLKAKGLSDTDIEAFVSKYLTR